MRPHLLIHRGRHSHRSRRCQGYSGQQVVSSALSEAGDHVGCRRRNNHQVCPPGEFDVSHTRFSRFIEQLGMSGLARQRLHSEGCDELGSAARQDDLNDSAVFFEQPHQLCPFIGSNAT